jgi:hypothetical protein
VVDDGLSAVDICCEQIRQQLGMDLTANVDAYAFVMGAHTATRWWYHADVSGVDTKEKRIRAQRFFAFVIQAYETATGWRAGVTWDRTSGVLQCRGEFFALAKICHDVLLPSELAVSSNVALGKVLNRALKRRTIDGRPKKPAGRKPRLKTGL